MRKVGLFTHPACLEHDPGPHHPECPDRLRVVLQALDHPDFATLIREEAPLADEALLTLAHPADHVRAILALRPGPGERRMLDADTVVSAGSVEAARRAVGGAAAAVDAVMEGRMDHAFVATRPPGHHAERSTPMGFCLFNQAAIAAMHARARWGLARVAVVDFDVHHGNGTQHMFEAEPALFYVSSHQMPCYPGTGAASETGVGNIVNLPLPPGAGGAEFRAVWEREGVPAVAAFAPDFIILSAGFDAHRADPLAQLRLDEADFGWIAEQLTALATRVCRGRLISILEGGYDLAALASSTAAHVRRLLTA